MDISFLKQKNEFFDYVNRKPGSGHGSGFTEKLGSGSRLNGCGSATLPLIFFFSVCQEPGTNAEIKKFAQSFKVQFDMFEKVDVNGSNAHPVWVYLKAKKGGLLGMHRFTSEQLWH
jgi:hypothetical protein